MFGQIRNQKRAAKFFELIYKSPSPQVGQTPKEIIWTKNKAKLYHYKSLKGKVHPTPILMIYALINRPYIMDLHPGNSLVEYLVGAGFDVYMLDWGIPGIEDKNMKFDDYLCDYLPPVVNKVLAQSKASEFTLMGYCMGGTITAMFAALYPGMPVKSMVLLAAPIDFSDSGLFSVWLKGDYFNVDKMVDVLGNIPPELIDYGNKLLKPVSNFYSAYTSLWENLHNEKFIDSWKYINHWVRDGVPFPGEAFRQWIKDFYQQNKLVRKEFRIRGQKLDLSQIRCPILNITADRDHIVRPNQSKLLEKYVSVNCDFLSVPAGHVSLVIGRTAKNITWPKIQSWLT